MNELLEKIQSKKAKICVVGLGYVGLPTALFFAAKGFHVTGCDLDKTKVDTINSGKSPLEELGMDELLSRVVSANLFNATTDTAGAVKESDVVLVVVPTPVTPNNQPDLNPVKGAAKAIAQGLGKGKLVILESTVYPGVTEEVMQPILEETGLKAGIDFGLGYCPERYNPGDPERTIEQMARIVSGITLEWAEVAKELYSQITSGEVTIVKNIKTAEAGKVIENIQRDLNIALVNELALVFEKMGIDVLDVIKAASTKWNFHVYHPGPGVGGHCIPVDPYYLVYKARELGYDPQVITAGRQLNDSMPFHVVDLAEQGLSKTGKTLSGSRVLILGFSYKPDVADPRETPGEDIVNELKNKGAEVLVLDPKVSSKYFADKEIQSCASLEECGGGFDALVLVTYHSDFKKIDWSDVAKKSPNAVVVDGPRKLSADELTRLGFNYLGVGLGVRE